MLVANWPFNKITFFSSEAIAFFKSFLNMYRNMPLPSCETVPLKDVKMVIKDCFFYNFTMAGSRAMYIPCADPDLDPQEATKCGFGSVTLVTRMPCF